MIAHEKVERNHHALLAIVKYLSEHAAPPGCEHAHRTALLSLIDIVGFILRELDARISRVGPEQSTAEKCDCSEVAFAAMRVNRDPFTGNTIDQYCDSRHAADNAPCLRVAGHDGRHVDPSGYCWF